MEILDGLAEVVISGDNFLNVGIELLTGSGQLYPVFSPDKQSTAHFLLHGGYGVADGRGRQMQDAGCPGKRAPAL